VPGPYQREDIRAPEFGRETPAHAQKKIIFGLYLIHFGGGALGFCKKWSKHRLVHHFNQHFSTIEASDSKVC
jgi:hypothetical protein